MRVSLNICRYTAKAMQYWVKLHFSWNIHKYSLLCCFERSIFNVWMSPFRYYHIFKWKIQIKMKETMIDFTINLTLAILIVLYHLKANLLIHFWYILIVLYHLKANLHLCTILCSLPLLFTLLVIQLNDYFACITIFRLFIVTWAFLNIFRLFTFTFAFFAIS